MALRFTVQGDTEAETAAGLQLLVDAGLQVIRRPVDTIGSGWLARDVPTTKAPAVDGRGPGVSG